MLCYLPFLHVWEGLRLFGRDMLQQPQVHENDERAFHQMRSQSDDFAMGRAKDIADRLITSQAVHSQSSIQSLACMARQSNASQSQGCAQRMTFELWQGHGHLG